MSKKFFIIIFLMLMTPSAFCTSNFTIVPTPDSIIPTAAPTGNIVSAYYTITNRTSIPLRGYTVQGLPPTVTQNTQGTYCPAIINLNSQASCILQLDITGPTVSSFGICHGSSCTTTAVPLNLTAGYGSTYAYVADNTANLWQCPLNATGGFQQSDCTALGSFSQIIFTTFDAFSGINYAYLSNNNNTLWKCTLNATGGFSGPCTAITNTPSFFATSSMTSQTFSGTTYAYVAAFDARLWKCAVTNTGDFITPCAELTNTPAFDKVVGVTFNQFNGNTYGYVADFTNKIWKCQMTSTGNFNGACTALTNTTAPGFNKNSIVLFKKFSNILYAYVTDFSQNLWKCPVDTTGNFGAGCLALNNTSAFNQTNVVTSFNFSDQTYMYLGDNSSNVWQCPMNNVGNFSDDCTALSGFNVSINAAFQSF